MRNTHPATDNQNATKVVFHLLLLHDVVPNREILYLDFDEFQLYRYYL